MLFWKDPLGRIVSSRILFWMTKNHLWTYQLAYKATHWDIIWMTLDISTGLPGTLLE